MKQKFYKKKLLAIFAGLVTVFIASFGDEMAVFTFLFAKVNSFSMVSTSLLMSCELLGGLSASPISMMLLHKLKITTILKLIFLIPILLLVISAKYQTSLIFYISSFILGATIGIFWSVVSVLIPSNFTKERLIDINKIVQSIRNLGYCIVPFLAGLVNSIIGIQNTLLIVIFIFILAIPCSLFFLNRPIFSKYSANKNFIASEQHLEKMTFLPKIISFFSLPKMKITLLPLIVTICTTSTFNVAFMYLLLVHRHYPNSLYGIIVSAISLGLVLGPILFSTFAKKAGVGFGACCAATIIGLCVCLSGVNQSVAWLYIILFVLGMANGIQNTLMATLVMQTVPKKERRKLMPTYMFIIQFSVLSGFILAGQIHAQYAQQLLIVSGLIACSFGIVGAIGNLIADKRHLHS